MVQMIYVVNGTNQADGELALKQKAKGLNNE